MGAGPAVVLMADAVFLGRLHPFISPAEAGPALATFGMGQTTAGSCERAAPEPSDALAWLGRLRAAL